MTVNVTRNGDGTITCWGKEKMLIPEGGAHVRSCTIASPVEFKEEPCVTVSISGGQGVEVFLLSEIKFGAPRFNSIAINAQNGLNLQGRGSVASTFEYVCYFHITGKPL
jgi:hypothetical protein